MIDNNAIDALVAPMQEEVGLPQEAPAAGEAKTPNLGGWGGWGGGYGGIRAFVRVD